MLSKCKYLTSKIFQNSFLFFLRMTPVLWDQGPTLHLASKHSHIETYSFNIQSVTIGVLKTVTPERSQGGVHWLPAPATVNTGQRKVALGSTEPKNEHTVCPPFESGSRIRQIHCIEIQSCTWLEAPTARRTCHNPAAPALTLQATLPGP